MTKNLEKQGAKEDAKEGAKEDAKEGVREGARAVRKGVSEGVRARRERLLHERALRDLEGLKHEGGGFGGGWTHSALVRSLLHTRGRDREDFTPTLRRVVVVLRVLAFVLLSVWFLRLMAGG